MTSTTGLRADRAARGRAAGFTLLELVLVMVIIGALLGAASPSLRGFFVSRQTNDAAGRIAALTRLARSHAIARGCTCRLSFDQTRRSYALSVLGYLDHDRIGAGLGREYRLPQGVELDVFDEHGGRDYVDFFPDGRAEPATIRLTDVKGGVVEVVCDSPSGTFDVRTPEDAT